MYNRHIALKTTDHFSYTFYVSNTSMFLPPASKNSTQQQ